MKKINFKKMFRGRNLVVTLFILAAVFLAGNFVFAGVGDWAGNVVGGIIALFIRAISSILILLVGVLMKVAAYSDFINAPAVSKGWVVVRDLCNMFFVIILLVIAFATILGQEEYGAKKMLPKLIIAAVLINFSKMICGLMIDVASVVMLTFVNAFSAIGAGNILDLLGIAEVTQIKTDSESISFATVVSAYIFGLLYVIIATVVVASMLGMLVIRIVYIWIYTVLSPLAFFLQAVPGKGQQYASKWWDEWTKNLLVGPIIAFFLWLSFAALQGSNPIQGSAESDAELAASNKDVGEIDAGVGSKAGTTSSMAKFVIAIGMLLGGMKIAQEVGGEAGKALSKGMSALNKGKTMALNTGKSALKNTGKAVGRGGLYLAGQGANLASLKKDSNGKWKNEGNKLGNFALAWQKDLVGTRKKEKKEAAAKYLKKIGIGEKGMAAGKDLRDSEGFQKVTSSVKGGAVGAAGAIGLGLATGGVGFAMAPIATLIASALGGGAVGGVGAFGVSSKRENNKKIISEQDNKQNELLGAKANLRVHDENQKTVDDFEIKKQTHDNLKLKKWQNGGTLAPDEQDELDKSKAYINDKDNVNKYNSSKSYLTTSNRQDKEDKVNDLELAVAGGKDAYNKAKGFNKWTNSFETFKNTNKVFEDSLKKKQVAKNWVSAASNDNALLQGINKPSDIYSSAGLSETWKNRFEELNNNNPESNKAIDNMVSELGSGTIDDKKIQSLAKALAAFKKGGGKVDSSTLGRLESSLGANGHDVSSYEASAVTQYRQLGSFVEDVKDGEGVMQYDTFAKNSAKSSSDRSAAKDIMGASFGKINDKAKELGIDYQLDAGAGVNQKIDGAKLSGLSKIMSSLIDDEIKALEQAGGTANSANIAKLNAAKARFAAGDISSMSLKNTDVVYKGETDSEKRRNEYNTTQHETMHQYGAENEEAVDYGAKSLQEAKLVGKVSGDPENSGKRYDEVLGGLIAKLEQAGASQETMAKAITDQVSKWQTPNAQRVIETETGERETVNDVLGKKSETEQPEVNMEKVEQAINKLSDKLAGAKVSSGPQKVSATMSNEDRQFFIRHFEGLKKKVEKSGNVLSGKISPLSAVAASKELDR